MVELNPRERGVAMGAGTCIPKDQCVHGRCKDHKTVEDISEEKVVVAPGILKKTYWTYRCCGKAMAKAKKVQIVKCTTCDSIQERTVPGFGTMALCLCCGRFEQVYVGGDF